MPRCYIGNDGYYEIYNQTSIIHQKINEGKTTYNYKIYNNVKKIPSSQDRWRIEQLIFGNGINENLTRLGLKIN